MSLEFRLLGPLEIRSGDDVVPIRQAKQRALLAALLVNANHTVSTDELVNRIWDDDAPPAARDTLQSYVMRLRRVLNAAGSPLVTRPDGYLIEVEPDCLDVDRFESLIQQAKSVTGDPVRTAELLRDALELWRGDPLSDVPSAYLHREVVPLWREHQLAAVELHVETDLRLGRYHDLAIELAELTIRHPFQERFWAQRMIALYRSGRAAEALRCYGVIRDLLADELGTDPGPELTTLHRSILANDPALVVPDTTPRPPPRNDLPGDIPDFAGRTEEIRGLLGALPCPAELSTTVVISAVDGMAGVGKTTLVVHAAHRLAHRYPDGQLFLDLRGHTEHAEPIEPAAALDTLLRAIGVPADRIPAEPAERAAAWRAELAGRKVLLVLDNASSTGQVRPLLPGAPGCLALITSRRRLADLDTTATLSLDVLPDFDALALFTSVVGADRVAAEPGATSDVLRLCGHLPLAIRIAAARLRTRPAWPISTLADRLRDIDELAVGDRSVTAALTLSYCRLTAGQQHLFTALGQHPGTSFDAYQAAALAGTPLSETERMLDALVDVHLVREPLPGRYRCHDLVRQYARTHASASSAAATGRLLDHFRYLAQRMDAYLNPDTRRGIADLPPPPGPVPDITGRDDAIRWCETELGNLMAAIDHAARDGWRTHAWQLAYALTWFFKLRGHVPADWITQLRVGVKAVTDDVDRANLLRELSSAHYMAGDLPAAIDVGHQALREYRHIGDVWGEGGALNSIGNAHKRAGDFTEAVDHYRQALAVRQRAGDVRGTGVTLHNLCHLYQTLGQFAESLDCGERALAAYRATGDRRGEGMVLNNIAILYLSCGHDPAKALGYCQQGLALNRAVGDRRNEANALDTLGSIHRELGDYETALDYLHQALAMVSESGHRNEEPAIRANVLNTYSAVVRTE
ncbi:MAG TPA: BTAD domain-containing putative transcriptional regulator [Pseudonocardiaceae bacterium]|nr:BTAD domain-containing putative transcriptional regulator [Pseudonocardiaceae bacterium]